MTGYANFFETRATESSEAATRGNSNSVWDSFDRRQTPKGAASDVLAAESEGEDMFARAGMPGD